jgi:hypothetical protein
MMNGDDDNPRLLLWSLDLPIIFGLSKTYGDRCYFGSYQKNRENTSLDNSIIFKLLAIDIWQHELTSFYKKDANHLSENRKIVKG